MSAAIALHSFILLVDDQDDAIAFFVDQLGFTLLENQYRTDGTRWVSVAPQANTAVSIILKRAVSRDEQAQVGQQAGDGVVGIFEVSNFAQTYAQYEQARVTFLTDPEFDGLAMTSHFVDLYGNKWELRGPRESMQATA